jgi:hypothetical protein
MSLSTIASHEASRTAGRVFLFVCLTLTLLGTRLNSAEAQYTPLICATSPYNHVVPVNLGATRFDRSPVDGNAYVNNTDYSWTLMMNPNVHTVELHTPGFNTESGFDFLRLTYNTGGSSTTDFTGIQGAGSSQYITAGAATSEKTIDFRWHSDVSIYGTPARFDTASFECAGSNSAINTITVSNQGMSEGLLLGTGDVIYAAVSQPANEPLLISVNALATTAVADFDLFVSPTTSLPTLSNYAWKSSSSSVDEFLTIPSTGSARTIFMSVYAFTGGGHFSLHVMNQGVSPATKHLIVCTSGFALNTGSSTYPVLVQMLQNTSLHMLAASHGNLWISGYDIYQVPASPVTCASATVPAADYCTSNSACQICMNSASDIDGCTPGQSCGGVSRIANIGCGQYADSTPLHIKYLGWTWNHELGHSQLGFADEYYDGPFCGHSIMGGRNSNFYCDASDHCRDGSVDADYMEPRCASGTSNWTRAPAAWVRPFTSTEPDVEIFNNWNVPAMASVSVVTHTGLP